MRSFTVYAIQFALGFGLAFLLSAGLSVALLSCTKHHSHRVEVIEDPIGEEDGGEDPGSGTISVLSGSWVGRLEKPAEGSLGDLVAGRPEPDEDPSERAGVVASLAVLLGSPVRLDVFEQERVWAVKALFTAGPREVELGGMAYPVTGLLLASEDGRLILELVYDAEADTLGGRWIYGREAYDEENSEPFTGELHFERKPQEESDG